MKDPDTAEEAKNQLATKEDLYTLTWRFIGLMGLMTAILLGAMHFMHSDEIAYINDALAHLKP